MSRRLNPLVTNAVWVPGPSEAHALTMDPGGQLMIWSWRMEKLACGMDSARCFLSMDFSCCYNLLGSISLSYWVRISISYCHGIYYIHIAEDIVRSKNSEAFFRRIIAQQNKLFNHFIIFFYSFFIEFEQWLLNIYSKSSTLDFGYPSVLKSWVKFSLIIWTTTAGLSKGTFS